MKAIIKETGQEVEVVSRFMPKKRNAPGRAWVCVLNDERIVDEDALEYLEQQPAPAATIKGWVARDKYGILHLFCDHPRKGDTQWNPMSAKFMAINPGLFLDHYWPDDPIQVELLIIRK